MSEVTYIEFANSPCPWVPDQPFWTQNAAAMRGVMGLVAQDYPHAAEIVDFDPAVLPDDDQRKALWKLLMGRQHGKHEQSDGKIDITPNREAAYRNYLDNMHYGPHPIMRPSPIRADVEYDYCGLIGGGPQENTDRLRAVGENVREVFALTGQRQRGVWGIPGEESVPALMGAVGRATGTDMDELTARSPWIQAQLRRDGEGWEKPFGSEHDIYRLTGEAAMSRLIDWKNYSDTVHATEPFGLNEPLVYEDQGQALVVPARDYGMVTYDLKDGRRLHVVNGAADPDRSGMKRATSTSIAKETLEYVPAPSRMVVLGTAPHIRAAVDTIIPFLTRSGLGIDRMDIAATPWIPQVTAPVAALGELMATMKADYRLREALRGGNPDSPELAKL